MKQEEIFRHRSSMLPDCGYMVRIMEGGLAAGPRIRYSHRDDYYMMGVVVGGKLDCQIDFQHYLVESDSFIVLTPGQVHQFMVEDDITGYMLAVDPGLLNDGLRNRLNQWRAFHSPVCAADDYSDLVALYGLILRQESVSVGANLVRAAVELIVDKITASSENNIFRTDRRQELMFMFMKLLNEHITKERRPGFYAERMNVSTVYLNEIVNAVAGVSASEYIKNEIVLLAKRELFYTSDSIKKISSRLGFNDNAYFSRLFAEVVGVAPKMFRKNLDKCN
ncbi:MAG: helix-turn-helix domain-containing protein [Bacteroides sp.]|nr:helix-turn-helix domain-containing protein [Bacteroides sp.]